MIFTQSRNLLIGGFIHMALGSLALAEEVTVRVTNIDTTRPGNIMAMVFSVEGFPIDHDKALMVENRKADSPEMEFRFPVDQQRFAVKILHDEDESGKTSKNWTGIVPSEGLGFSNGARLSWRGAPTFDQAELSLEDVKGEIAIPIIYP